MLALANAPLDQYLQDMGEDMYVYEVALDAVDAVLGGGDEEVVAESEEHEQEEEEVV